MAFDQSVVDEDLLHLLKTDADKAVELIFRKYYHFVCNVIFRILPDQVSAEDIAQDVFFEIWKKSSNLLITTSLKAYLRKAAVNKTLNHIRDKKWKFDEEDAILNLQDTHDQTGSLIETAETEAHITRLIDELPHRCRAVFMLSRFEELSYQEIADQLGISIKTVENQISKALKYLRLHFLEHPDPKNHPK